MTKNFGWRLALVCAALLGGFSTQAGEPATGFAFAKEGNRYVGEQCKDQVVQIRSAMSGVSMAPEVWWVVYYDPTATLKSAEVKFVHGKMADVKRPMRLLEPIGGNNLPLDRDKLKTDWNRPQEGLSDVRINAVGFFFESPDVGAFLWAMAREHRGAFVGVR